MSKTTIILSILLVLAVALFIKTQYTLTQTKADATAVAQAAATYVNATNGSATDWTSAQPLVKVLTSLNTIDLYNTGGSITATAPATTATA